MLHPVRTWLIVAHTLTWLVVGILSHSIYLILKSDAAKNGFEPVLIVDLLATVIPRLILYIVCLYVVCRSENVALIRATALIFILMIIAVLFTLINWTFFKEDSLFGRGMALISVGIFLLLIGGTILTFRLASEVNKNNGKIECVAV